MTKVTHEFRYLVFAHNYQYKHSNGSGAGVAISITHSSQSSRRNIYFMHTTIYTKLGMVLKYNCCIRSVNAMEGGRQHILFHQKAFNIAIVIQTLLRNKQLKETLEAYFK